MSVAKRMYILIAVTALGLFLLAGISYFQTECSGQLIPDTRLSFSSVTAGANPSLN
jgi:hypothetical protein